MRTIMATLTVSAILWASFSAAQEPGKAAREKLVGVWDGYAVEGKGEKPNQGAVKLELTISKDFIKAKQFKGKETFDLGEGTFEILLDSTPSRLDGNKKLDNPNRKEVWLGIYQLEGDTLKGERQVLIYPHLGCFGRIRMSYLGSVVERSKRAS